jgi:hypothetical protein
MVGDVEVFPFDAGFEFDVDGEAWFAEDQYCVRWAVRVRTPCSRFSGLRPRRPPRNLVPPLLAITIAIAAFARQHAVRLGRAKLPLVTSVA